MHIEHFEICMNEGNCQCRWFVDEILVASTGLFSYLYILLHMFCLLIFDIFLRFEEVNKLLFLYTGQVMPNNSPRLMGNNKFAKHA